MYSQGLRVTPPRCPAPPQALLYVLRPSAKYSPKQSFILPLPVQSLYLDLPPLVNNPACEAIIIIRTQRPDLPKTRILLQKVSLERWIFEDRSSIGGCPPREHVDATIKRICSAGVKVAPLHEEDSHKIPKGDPSEGAGGACSATSLSSANGTNGRVVEGCEDVREVCWRPEDMVVCEHGDGRADVAETKGDLMAFLFAKLGLALALFV